MILAAVALIVTPPRGRDGDRAGAGSGPRPLATLERVTTLDLRKYRLRSGESLRDEQEVEIAPIELGGQRYLVVPENVPAELTVTRASTGTVYELRFHVRLHGPCFRCLGDAVLDERPLAPRVPGRESRAAPRS